MRVDLKVPYTEKDTAKALRARWDAAKKIWYIQDVADVTPFLRWNPDVQAATKGSVGGATRQSTGTGDAAPASQTERIITKSTVHERNIADLVDSMADLLATSPPPSKRPIGFVPQEETPSKPMAAALGLTVLN